MSDAFALQALKLARTALGQSGDASSLGAVPNDPTQAAANKAVFDGLAGKKAYLPSGANYAAGKLTSGALIDLSGPGRINGLPVKPSLWRQRDPLKVPDALGFRPPVQIWREGSGWRWRMDLRLFDRARQTPTAKHLYVAPALDNGDGSQGSPFNSLAAAQAAAATAFATVTAVVVHVQPGLYSSARTWNYPALSAAAKTALEGGHCSFFVEDFQATKKPLRAYAFNGSRATEDFSAWAPLSSGRYQATIAAPVYALIDARFQEGVHADEMPRLTQVTSGPGDVTPGTWHVSGTAGQVTVTVALGDGRAPDSDLWAIRDLGRFFQWPRTPYALYMEGIDFVGPWSPDGNCITPALTNAKGSGSVCLVDCGVSYNPLGSGFRTHDMAWSVYVRCRAACVYDDLYSAHAPTYPVLSGTMLRPLMVVLDCHGQDAGSRDFWLKPASAANNSNVVTNHDGSDTLMVNQSGTDTKGPLLGFVKGCRYLSVGARLGRSLPSGSGQIGAQSDGTADPSGTIRGAIGYLIDTVSEPVTGVEADLKTNNPADVIYVDGWTGGYSVDGAGSVNPYVAEYAQDGGGATSRPVYPTGPDPAYTTAVSISGAPVIGGTLTADDGVVAYGSSTGRKWEDVPSTGTLSTAKTYSPVDADYGLPVRLTGTAEAPDGRSTSSVATTNRVYPAGESARTTALFQATPTVPSRALRSAVDAFVAGLDAATWAAIDRMHLVLDTLPNTLIGIKTQKAATASGTLTFNARANLEGDLATGYVSMGEAINTAGYQYSLNQGTIFSYLHAAGGAAGELPQFGTNNGARATIRVNADGSWRGMANCATYNAVIPAASGIGMTSRAGFRAIARYAASDQRFYYGAADNSLTEQAATTLASTAIPTGSVYALRDGAVYGSRISAWGWGVMNATQLAAINSGLRTLFNAMASLS